MGLVDWDSYLLLSTSVSYVLRHAPMVLVGADVEIARKSTYFNSGMDPVLIVSDRLLNFGPKVSLGRQSVEMGTWTWTTSDINICIVTHREMLTWSLECTIEVDQVLFVEGESLTERSARRVRSSLVQLALLGFVYFQQSFLAHALGLQMTIDEGNLIRLLTINKCSAKRTIFTSLMRFTVMPQPRNECVN